MSIEERSAERRKRISVNKASGFDQADEWDLLYWQSFSPEERLSALVAIRNDLVLIENGKKFRASRKQ